MSKLFILLLLVSIGSNGFSQSSSKPEDAVLLPVTSASVFSHNDYVQHLPFYGAYSRNVGFIEADVFAVKGDLLVAHTLEEITAEATLDELYLRPLKARIAKNHGYVLADTTRTLTLMIDFKSAAGETMALLVSKLAKYPSLTACRTLRIVVSGNMPATDTWATLPLFISFDGRPSTTYSPEQLRRVVLISDDFSKYGAWKGQGKLPEEEENRIKAVRDEAHALGKPLRLWATPDQANAWKILLNLGVDVVNTDNVDKAVAFVERYNKDSYGGSTPYVAYKPVSTFAAHALPKNIILLIGDGTGLAQIYAGFTANRGSLNMFNMGTVGLSITTAVDKYITDSAAGATAFSTGTKTRNRYIGVDSAGVRLTTIAEILKTRGYHTTIASSGDITDATPASFYAHQIDRRMSEEIAGDFMQSNVDILIGGRKDSFVARKDNVNLFQQLQRKGYAVSDNLAALDTITTSRFVIIDDAAGNRAADGRAGFLSKAFKKSLEVTLKTKQPFFMMFEGAQVDWGGHDNDLAYLTTELLDLDQLVGEAVKFADQNKETLVIVTADHETGGLTLTGGSIPTGEVASRFTTGGHTAVPVPVFAFGPGADQFKGVYNNTEIFHKMRQLTTSSPTATPRKGKRRSP